MARKQPTKAPPLEELDIEQHPDLLDELQGNILKGHGRNYSAGIFVALSEQKGAARKAIAELTPLVWSAQRQRESAKAWRNRAKSGKPDGSRERESFCMLSVSARCYKRLDLDQFGGPAQAQESQPSQAAAIEAFRNGMKAEVETPYAHWDPDTDAWESPLKQDFDLFILLANNEERNLDEAVDDLKAVLSKSGAVRIEIERGRKSARASDLGKAGVDPVEHFGFADGIAMPVFFKSEGEKLKHRKPSPVHSLDTILWPESGVDGEASFGSFLTVMKLEQNVRAFRQRAAELKDALDLVSTDEAEALAVGRLKDGKPLLPTASGDRDDFNYDNDPLDRRHFGAKQCPASAHIRRMNPRREPQLVMARRGFHYGEPWMEQLPPPENGVGLIFMALASTLHSFIVLMGATQGPSCTYGVDAVIGKSQPGRCEGSQHWWSEKSATWVEFQMADFVKPLGGEYFFVPSLRFLRAIEAETLPRVTT